MEMTFCAMIQFHVLHFDSLDNCFPEQRLYVADSMQDDFNRTIINIYLYLTVVFWLCVKKEYTQPIKLKTSLIHVKQDLGVQLTSKLHSSIVQLTQSLTFIFNEVKSSQKFLFYTLIIQSFIHFTELHYFCKLNRFIHLYPIFFILIQNLSLTVILCFLVYIVIEHDPCFPLSK